MSSAPLLSDIDTHDMTTPADVKGLNGLEEVDGRLAIRTGSGSIPDDDPTAPSQAVSSKKQRISDLWTIFCSGCALISDGYANSLMTMINVILATQHPTEYTSAVSTRVSNALLVGEICGQITIG